MLKQFFSVMARYLRPYRKYLGWSVVLNFLSQSDTHSEHPVQDRYTGIYLQTLVMGYAGQGTHRQQRLCVGAGTD